jgi:amino acid adenylation domain-containing protein
MHDGTIEGFRLSQQQRRLWTLAPEAALAAQCVVLVEGPLQLPKLESAVQRVIAQHEILRTTFHQLPGMKFPVQVVHERSTPSWSSIDFSHLEQQERDSRIEQLCLQEQRRDFVLDRDPLLHLMLVTLGARESVLLVSVPALCADSLTLKNFVQQLAAGYDTNLETQAFQYAQYAEWQNNVLRSEAATVAKEHWNLLLPEGWTASSLPYEIKTSNRGEFRPESVPVSLTPEAWTRFPDVDSFLLAVWQTLIWRLTGDSEVLVGRVLAREHELLLEAFGPFEKCVPTVTHFNASIGVSSIARAIARALPAAVDAQEFFDPGKYPPLRQPEGEAFFPFMFSSSEWRGIFKSNDLTFTIRDTRVCNEIFRVMLKVDRVEDLRRAELVYDANHFLADDIRYLAHLFEVLVESALASPEASVGTLEIVSKQFVLSGVESDYPSTCVHEQFERQAELSPEAVAVVCGDAAWSYQELNERSNQVARYLQRQGVGVESKVGLLLERSPWLLCGMLGVLKAGAAYVPLDVMSPALRLREQVADAGVAVVLSEQRWAEKLAGARVLYVDGAEQESRAAVASGVRLDNLAYVIYTSGSTGKPKGVMVSHGSLSNLAAALKRTIYHRLGPQQRVSLNAPFTFDASVKQWIQLLDGHTLDIIPEEVRYDPATLLDYARQHGIDVLDCTPTQLRALVATGLLEEDQHAFAAVLCGGDQLDEKTWQTLSSNPRTRFYNVYGPTECTVDATICALDPEQTRPTLGLPIQNAHVYWLDSQLQQVPRAVAGGIFIGGAGVARGYLGRPDLTAERFIPDPFSTQPGARLYRTGDMARYHEGALEFLGRQDHQVKLRGFRIELQEIETHLRAHPAIRDAVVLVHEDASYEKHLVAYVTASAVHGTDLKSDLRNFLRERLVEFMVPTTIKLVEAFPLTRHGKVDRSALSTVPERSVNREYLPPRNATETAIAAVWREVLEIEKVGLHDNFFDLGGHSLSLARAYGKLKETSKREFSIIDMFTYPTVSSFAEFLSTGTQENSETRQLIHERAARQKQASARLWHKSRTSGLDTVSTGSDSDLVGDQHAIFPDDS